MPQRERSVIIKEIIKWLNTKQKGVTVKEFQYHVKWEITEG
jgi:hypothetical protein